MYLDSRAEISNFCLCLHALSIPVHHFGTADGFKVGMVTWPLAAEGLLRHITCKGHFYSRRTLHSPYLLISKLDVETSEHEALTVCPIHACPLGLVQWNLRSLYYCNWAKWVYDNLYLVLNKLALSEFSHRLQLELFRLPKYWNLLTNVIDTKTASRNNCKRSVMFFQLIIAQIVPSIFDKISFCLQVVRQRSRLLSIPYQGIAKFLPMEGKYRAQSDISYTVELLIINHNCLDNYEIEVEFVSI